MRYAKADHIAALVNNMAPDHEVGAASPEAVENKRVANCFARAALVGAGLVGMGVHKRDMTMLVGMNHGRAKAAYGISSEVPYWYGHAMLVVHDKRPTVVFDSTDHVFAYSARVAGWEQSYHGEPPLFLVDTGRLFAPPSEYAHTRMPGAVWRLGAHSTVHTLAEGIEFYQQMHPVLAAEPEWELEDFRVAYRALSGLQ